MISGSVLRAKGMVTSFKVSLADEFNRTIVFFMVIRRVKFILIVPEICY